MRPVEGEDLSQRQAPPTDEGVAGEVVEVPPVRGERAVEPDRVVQAGGEERLVERLVGLAAHRMGLHDGVGGQVVAHVGQRGGLTEPVLTDRLGGAQPRGGPAPAVAFCGRTHPIPGDERPLERRAPRARLQLVRRRQLRRRGQGLDVGRSLVALEAGLQVEDRSHGLAGDDTAGGERAPVADPVDLVAHRFVVVAPADEIGPQRVDRHLVRHGVGGGHQRLGDDLAAVEAAPRVTGADPDVDVTSVALQVEDAPQVHDRRR